MNENAPAPSGIILFAKQPGKTSFSSLFTVKHALGTKKVGHTGTLDSFAQGLMVVLSGGMTRLVPYITAFDKTYEAVISFGAETDTLDPNGTVIKTAPLPAAASLTGAVSRFRGQLDQKPPLYSAVHVDGKRASDVARKGGSFDIPTRKITVYSSEILEMQNENGEVIPPFDLSSAGELIKYAHIRFHVSKGTYIRSLARDIAESCGSAAHLAGLLRTKVGSFSLEDAAGCTFLKPFSIENVLAENAEIAEEKARQQAAHPDAGEARQKAVRPEKSSEQSEMEISLQQAVRDKMKTMSPSVAAECGLIPVLLKPAFEATFFNGRPLKRSMFERMYGIEKKENAEKIKETEKIEKTEKVEIIENIEKGEAAENKEFAQSVPAAAVFAEDGHFSGVISIHGERASYQYVVPRIKPAAQEVRSGSAHPETQASVANQASAGMRIFSWNDIARAYEDSDSDVRAFFKDGSALTIGGFDGPHAGHMKLFDAVLEYALKTELKGGAKLKKGVVTFARPPHSVCSANLFSGDVSTLRLKLDLFALKGFDFVIVIDFSSDFSRMRGNDFLSILKDCCSMQFAAAGCDFRCGHQLDTGVAELSAFARQNDFQFQVIDDVTYNGTRISSSLIRTCVQTGRLREAEMLLGRPYTVDLKKVTGIIRNDVHCLLQIANGDVLQVLPPEGKYPVKATSAGARICNTVLYVDSSLLRLEIPPEWASAGIEKIEFTTLVS